MGVLGHPTRGIPGLGVPLRGEPSSGGGPGPVPVPVPRPWTPAPRPMADEDYQGLWELEVSEVEAKGGTLTLSLRAGRNYENIKLPQATFSKGELDEAAFTYPDLDENEIDQPVPIAYGPINGIKGALIDRAAGRYKFVGHPVRRFTNFYNQDGGTLAATSQDTAKGEAVFSGIPEGDSVFADLLGLSGNPPDTLEDAIEVRAGLSDALFKPAQGSADEGIGFGPYGSRQKWIIGTDVFGEEVTRPEISLFIRDRKSLAAIIKDVKRTAFALSYPSPSGQLVFKKWEPKPSADAPLLRSNEIYSVERTYEVETVYTRVIAKYRLPADFDGVPAQVVIVADERARLINGLPAHVDLELELPLHDRDAALLCASRQLAFRRQVAEVCQIETTNRALLWRPGKGLLVEHTRRVVNGEVVELSGYFEVLRIEVNSNSTTLRVGVSNWRGLTGEGPLYVMAADATFPDYLGGGSMLVWNKDWPPEKKRFAAQNGGYVCDENGFLDPQDRESYRRSVIL